jgi:DNA-binding NarL/FixJ family response regulator
MPAKELTTKRALIVTDDEAVFIEASRCFTELDFPIDRTRSFAAAGVLLAHLPYAAILVHLGRTPVSAVEQLEGLVGILQRAQGAPVVLLTATNLPQGTEVALRKDISIYVGRETPLTEIAQAIRHLVDLAEKRAATGGGNHLLDFHQSPNAML